VEAENAARDLERYQSVDERGRSQQQLDAAQTKQKNAAAQVSTAEAVAKAGRGDVERAEADVERARVNLEYCRIVAPSAGRVTLRTIEPGSYVATGQAMFSLVSAEVWVTANFKETQLKLMKAGQAVTIKVDAMGKKLKGHVDSIQAGSGSRFSVLPAENATGNFVKVVQRVPVKIVLDQDVSEEDRRLLSPGMSVVAKVKVR
jgi:membrane fusion protein, multidrug efflux system